MIQFEYSSPAQLVIFGPGAVSRLGESVDRFGWQRLLLCSSASLNRSGLIDQAKQSLGRRVVAVYDDLQPHVPDAQVEEALALATEHQIDAVIGMGGGSPIGLAKAVSLALEDKRAGTPNRQVVPYAQPSIPIVAIPTTYAGSEMTPVFGVTRRDGNVTRKVTVSDPRVTPKLVLYDPQLTTDLPPRLTASTGINALAHCVEAVYSITHNPLSTAAALDATRRIARALPHCYFHGSELPVRTDMLIASYLAGTALANVKMGLHHGICHVLGGTLGVPHGVANAIILPHAIRYNADRCASELALVAETMGLARDQRDDYALALSLADQVSELIQQMDLAQHLRDVGVKQSDLPLAAEMAAESRTVQNNPKPIDAAQVKEILQAAW